MNAVAVYLDLPPIWVYEAASFYSMFETRPVGRHSISVCTNISCMLCGGEDILAHIEAQARRQGGGEHRRRPDLPQARGGVPGRLLRGADDDGRSRLPREPDPREGRRDPGRAGLTTVSTPRTEAVPQPRVADEPVHAGYRGMDTGWCSRVNLPHAAYRYARAPAKSHDHGRSQFGLLWRPSGWTSRGASRATSGSAATRHGERSSSEKIPPEAVVEEVKKSGLARPWRGGFSGGPEVELHAQGIRRSDVRGVQLRRERARDVQGS